MSWLLSPNTRPIRHDQTVSDADLVTRLEC